MQRLACLEELATLSGELLVAARARDADAIARLGERYDALSNLLLQTPLATPSDPSAARIRELGELILQRQAAIEQAAAPWLDDMRIILRERRNDRALAAAYRQPE